MKSSSSMLKIMLILTLVLAGLSPSETYAESKTHTKGWKEISVGVSHSVAVKNDGSVWQWGNAIFYGPPEESMANFSFLAPKQVPNLDNIISVSGGQSHSLALRDDGTVWAWGGNAEGQLGDGTRIGNPTPRQLKELSDVIAVETDWSRSFAVTKDGSLWVWGGFFYRDWKGEIRNYDVPAKLADFTDTKAVSAGYGSFMALKKDGTVWSFSDKAERVEGVDQLVQIAVGAEYTYGLRQDGTVWVWGSNGYGRMNGDSIANDYAPRRLDGISDVAAVQASAGGPLLLKKDGTVWASGSNGGGQLGIGSFKSSEALVQVIGLKKITRIAAHGVGFRSMAIRADGTLWSWGMGYSGDGTKGSKTKPVGVKSYASEAIETDPIFVEVDGTILRFDQPPIIKNKQTMVPLRAIFDSLGAKTQWDAETSTITASKGSRTVILTVGKSTASVNGTVINLDAPPITINGNTLVPVRFISSSLGAFVKWDTNSNTVIIQSK